MRYEPVWVVRRSWSPLAVHAMNGWNRGEPQPSPVPKGYFTSNEPHLVRQAGFGANMHHEPKDMMME